MRGRILKPSGHRLMDSAPVRVVLRRLRNVMGPGRRLVRAECYLAFAGGLAPLETFTSLCNDRTGTHPEVMMGRCLQGFPGTFALSGCSVPSTAAALAIAGPVLDHRTISRLDEGEWSGYPGTQAFFHRGKNPPCRNRVGLLGGMTADSNDRLKALCRRHRADPLARRRGILWQVPVGRDRMMADGEFAFPRSPVGQGISCRGNASVPAADAVDKPPHPELTASGNRWVNPGNRERRARAAAAKQVGDRRNTFVTASGGRRGY